jgi:hypothetical protein
VLERHELWHFDALGRWYSAIDASYDWAWLVLVRAPMDWTYANLNSARAAAEALLGELGLADYVFVIEPKEDHCDVHVEYAGRSGWRDVMLCVDEDTLLASRGDPVARIHLLRAWREELKDAKRSRRPVRERRAERP